MNKSLWGALPELAMAYKSRCHAPATGPQSFMVSLCADRAMMIAEAARPTGQQDPYRQL